MGKRLSLISIVGCSLLLQACSTTSGGVSSTAMDRAIAGCVGSVAFGAVSGALIGAAIGGDRGAGRGAIIGAAAGAGRCVVLVEIAAAEDRQKVHDVQLATLQSNYAQTKTITTTKGKVATVRTKLSPAPLPPTQKSFKRKNPIVQKAAPVTVATPAPVPELETAVVTPTETINAQQGGTIVVAPQPQVAAAPTPATVQVETAFAEEPSKYTACRFTELIIDMDGQSADAGKQKWCKDRNGTWAPV